MNIPAIIDRISNEKDAILARNAISQHKTNLFKQLLLLEDKLDQEENELILIGKQRAYREMRLILQS
jgi:hypothetical protein